MALSLCVLSAEIPISPQRRKHSEHEQRTTKADKLLYVFYLSVSGSPSTFRLANIKSPWIISHLSKIILANKQSLKWAAPAYSIKQIMLWLKEHEKRKQKWVNLLIWSPLRLVARFWVKYIWAAVAWHEMVIGLASSVLLSLASQHKHLLCLPTTVSPNIKQQSKPALLPPSPSEELMTHQAN